MVYCRTGSLVRSLSWGGHISTGPTPPEHDLSIKKNKQLYIEKKFRVSELIHHTDSVKTLYLDEFSLIYSLSQGLIKYVL